MTGPQGILPSNRVPGVRYCPSNGTDGEGFMGRFCEHCERDRAVWEREDYEGGCDILARALAFDVEDDDYPDEWTYTTEGKPTCTAFVPLGTRLPLDSDLEAAGQRNMFGEAA